MAASEEAVPCSRCGGETEAGGMRDSYSAWNSMFRFQDWVWPFRRTSSFHQSLSPPAVGRAIPVIAWRCKACGHLDMFARG